MKLDETEKKDCFVQYRLTTEKISPKIMVSSSDFASVLTLNNTDIFKSKLTDRQSRWNEYKEICVDDYFGKLSHVGIRSIRNSGRSELGTKRFSCFMNMTVTAYFLNM